MTLSTFAAERRAAAPLLLSAGACCMAPTARLQLSIDISCPTLLLLSINGTDRGMDRKTDARPLHM